MDDYVFRYKIDPAKDQSCKTPDLLADFFIKQIQELLKLVQFCNKEKDVEIDGFKFFRNTHRVYDLYHDSSDSKENDKGNENYKKTDKKDNYQNISLAKIYEPRLDYFKSLIESVLSVVQLEKNKKIVDIDGFRLKSLSDWVCPAVSTTDIILHAASNCNLNCVFCYNHGAPPLLKDHRRPFEDEYKEVMTRIKYYSPLAHRGLFPNFGSPCEALAHPDICEILNNLRKKTSELFRIPTNGSVLTKSMISQLKEFAPILLDISLNSSNPLRRKYLMKDSNPEIAINSLQQLKSEKIPFAVVIVPWPFPSIEDMLDDLSKTVKHAAMHTATFIQINLPGYSSFFSKKKLFDLDTVWSKIVDRVRQLRQEVDCPLIARPSLYEENLHYKEKNLPEVLGVVKNSPMMMAGLKRKDIIKFINRIAIKNKSQARDLLTILHNSGLKDASITVQRGNKKVILDIDLKHYKYPYYPEAITHIGTVFLGAGFKIRYLEKLQYIIATYGAKNVLFLTSVLMEPVLKQTIAQNPYIMGRVENFEIDIPENKFFGGNIFMGDLLVVQDLIDAINKHIDKKEKKPDLVVIPSSPFNNSLWQRDLTGRTFSEIEKHVKIPVVLFECDTIFD